MCRYETPGHVIIHDEQGRRYMAGTPRRHQALPGAPRVEVSIRNVSSVNALAALGSEPYSSTKAGIGAPRSTLRPVWLPMASR
jgi:hypothetical protein